MFVHFNIVNFVFIIDIFNRRSTTTNLVNTKFQLEKQANCTCALLVVQLLFVVNLVVVVVVLPK